MDKIKWGVLGTAGIAKGQTIPGMVLAENCQLYAIAGRSIEKAEAFRQEFGFQVAYDSYQALLDDPQVEAVYIPLPNELHYAWTIRALKAKKHVLCEKPLAPTLAQIQEMIATAEENGVFLMEAFAYLHSPYMAAIKQELDSGNIGDVLYIESTFLTSDYDLSNIRMRRQTFGGSVYDLGCYTTSQILWLLGKDPERVQAVADFSDQNIDIYTTGILDFPGGTKACFQCGMLLAREPFQRVDRLQIHGSKGAIFADAEFNQCGELTYTVCIDGVQTCKGVSTPHNYKLEVEQMGRCIRGGETPFVSNAFTCRNARLMGTILEKIGY